jgi:hypothetical protein
VRRPPLLRTLFSAIGTAIIGLMPASSVEPGTTHPTLSAWYTVIAFVAITAALGSVSISTLPQTL